MGKTNKQPVLPRQKLSFGQKAADEVTKFVGSWTFIFIFLLYLFLWVILNVTAIVQNWDPYPFILLNLTLSCIAAIQAPLILMSQNRTAERDRIKAERDYMVNRKAEKEVENMQKDLDEIKEMIRNLERKL